jgi:glycosyltransferase involved in cell wall biosynthesis
VSFLGYKSGNELWNLVLNSSFVVVPSEWYENNPLTILEAYSLGKPVIGAQIGGIPEILIDNETGFLFKSGDLISLCNALLKAQQIDVEEYNNMSNKALSFAKSNFSEEIHYKKLISTYNKVIKQ